MMRHSKFQKEMGISKELEQELLSIVIRTYTYLLPSVHQEVKYYNPSSLSAVKPWLALSFLSSKLLVIVFMSPTER